HHLPHCREPDDRRAFPTDVVAFDEIEAARRQHEKAAIDQTAVAARLLDKCGHQIALTLQRSIAPGRTHCRDGRKLSMAHVKFDGRSNVQIAESITVGKTESLFVLDIVRDPFEPSAG